MKVVKSVPLYQQIYIQLRDAIFSGELELDSNQVINEVQLAKELDVSRGPVREAIRKLEQEGLLVRDGSNALRVYSPTLTDLKNIYQCRTVLEPFATKLACANLEQKQVDELNDILKEIQNLIYADDCKTYQELSQICGEFHKIIYESSGNPRLVEQIYQLDSISRFYRLSNVSGSERRKNIYKEHETILKLLIARDAVGVQTYMTEHLERDLENLMKSHNWPE